MFSWNQSHLLYFGTVPSLRIQMKMPKMQKSVLSLMGTRYNTKTGVTITSNGSSQVEYFDLPIAIEYFR
jgi:hypothetical protein